MVSSFDSEIISQLEQMPYEIIKNKQTACDCVFKLILVGDSAVGKSALMQRITTNDFLEDHEVTVGVEFGSLILKLVREQIHGLPDEEL